jgi:hypothetical protein
LHVVGVDGTQLGQAEAFQHRRLQRLEVPRVAIAGMDRQHDGVGGGGVGLIEVERQPRDLAAARHDLGPVVDDETAQRGGEVDGVGIVEHERRRRRRNRFAGEVEGDPPVTVGVGQLHDAQGIAGAAGQRLGE